MLVGVLSDIHNHLENLKKAIEFFNTQKVNLVCFCGDLTLPSTLEVFKLLNTSVRAVFGNMDAGNEKGILEKIKQEKLKILYPKTFYWEFKFFEKKIGVFHGHDQFLMEELLYQKNLDIVFSGHTHNFYQKWINKKTLWVNPGAIVGWTGLERRPVTPTVAIVDLKKNRVEKVRL